VRAGESGGEREILVREIQIARNYEGRKHPVPYHRLRQARIFEFFD
jgi:hypothetical protein